LKRVELNRKSTIRQKAEAIYLEGRSLYLFGPNNILRKFLSEVIAHPKFDDFILLLIMISTVLLTLDSPLDDPNSQKVYILDIFDTVMTILFTIELSIKVIVFGYACNGP
jgi:hypothetical protein